MACDPFWRKVNILRVVDGDTLIVEIDLGFRTHKQDSIRLIGVDTPELRSRDAAERERAQAAKTYVTEWWSEHARHASLTDPFPFEMRSEKDDSFGRWLGQLQCRQGHCLNFDLLDTGHATVYGG